MKTDLYLKVVLTIIAICLVIIVLNKVNLILPLRADSVSSVETNNVKTNLDGSINVRLVAADVIEVKPAYGATFKVEPYSSSTVFKVDNNKTLEIKPAYNTKFLVEPYSSSTEYRVKPAQSSTVFMVKEATSYMYENSVGGYSIRLYPNPVEGMLNIEYSIPSEQAEYLTICNMSGQMINRLLLYPENNKVELDTSQYPEGIYIYSCGTQSGKFIVK